MEHIFHFGGGDGEFDEYDIFDMIFGGRRGGRGHQQRAQRHQYHEPQQRYEDNRGNVPQVRGFAYLFQFMPFILLIVFTFLPYLSRGSKPHYSFSINEEYYKKQVTHINRITYYVGDSYLQTYQNEKEIAELHYVIERDFLNHLLSECQKSMRLKQEIEYKLSYYRNNGNYVRHFQNELNKLDMSSCNKYNSLRYNVR